ncbi:MAG: STM4014 family protein, partial [Cyanobacteria bacterium]|nr:STM4014 family protein [Cyanobacteriota bacterium]
MSKFPSDQFSFLIVGNENSRRVDLFQKALHDLGLKAARLVTYRSLLNGTASISTGAGRDTIIRIESPGRDFDVQRSILRSGTALAQQEDSPFITLENLETLPFRKGEILFPRQWYLGFCALLNEVSQQIGSQENCRLMNSIEDVQTMFDKSICHSQMASAGVSIPKSVSSPASYDDLVEKINRHNMTQVFLKLRHGSSGSGVVALRFGKTGAIAITTTEIHQDLNGELRFFNSRKIRRYETLSEVRTLVNFLCGHGVHVEEWIPKDVLEGKPYDLRILSIAGKEAHSVARLGNSPITNLHLLNERRDGSVALGQLPSATVERLSADVASV